MSDTTHALSATADVVQRANTPFGTDEARIAAEVEKGQQLAGHFPNAEALERGRRVYRGDSTYGEARAEVDAKYSRG